MFPGDANNPVVFSGSPEPCVVTVICLSRWLQVYTVVAFLVVSKQEAAWCETAEINKRFKTSILLACIAEVLPRLSTSITQMIPDGFLVCNWATLAVACQFLHRGFGLVQQQYLQYCKTTLLKLIWSSVGLYPPLFPEVTKSYWATVWITNSHFVKHILLSRFHL